MQLDALVAIHLCLHEVRLLPSLITTTVNYLSRYCDFPALTNHMLARRSDNYEGAKIICEAHATQASNGLSPLVLLSSMC